MCDLAELVENETIRWGLGGLGDGSLRVDGIRATEFEEFGADAGRRQAQRVVGGHHRAGARRRPSA